MTAEEQINADARIFGIKEIQRVCEESLDHDTPWPTFCELVRNRLEIETVFIASLNDKEAQ